MEDNKDKEIIREDSSQHLPTIKILSTGFRSTTFTVDWEKYIYENDVCCKSLYKGTLRDHNCIRWYCEYNPTNKHWELPVWMKEVFSMINEANDYNMKTA